MESETPNKYTSSAGVVSGWQPSYLNKRNVIIHTESSEEPTPSPDK